MTNGTRCQSGPLDATKVNIPNRKRIPVKSIPANISPHIVFHIRLGQTSFMHSLCVTAMIFESSGNNSFNRWTAATEYEVTAHKAADQHPS
jgi:hypothetical protein